MMGGLQLGPAVADGGAVGLLHLSGPAARRLALHPSPHPCPASPAALPNPPGLLRLLPPLQAMVSFELFGQAWVLFRDAEGRASCVLDECAHRACPLSVGRVVDGQIECPYHGAPALLLL